ncbi:dethiobiotin synthase [Leptolyngbya iicbica]|uniref:ATP-dependent dethiobiotin synthetase BioD n=2 Tax=Cyanophyceae TaxID=3028117 RepID=A0A4Q7E0W9_9CYAN|nr:dethiobiotin synthase [Leptolyngbya sp. LK]RZM75008.1 ATP-dependent dethiobiotin synthetase BioD [Leptolyngbya sp. LK]
MSTPVKNGLLITGSDTDVGKTIVTTAIAAYWLKHFGANSLGLMKPVQSGIGDFETYTRLFDLQQSAESLTPQRFAAPLAPPLAAAQEGKSIDLTVVWQHLSQLLAERQFVLVEALGGLGSPVTDEWTIADLAAAWHLPIVLVIPVKLGAIAQAVANTALARQYQLSVRGIILNCTAPLTKAEQQNWAPIDLIERLTQLPVLGTMPYLAQTDDIPALVQAASDLKLEALFPG